MAIAASVLAVSLCLGACDDDALTLGVEGDVVYLVSLEGDTFEFRRLESTLNATLEPGVKRYIVAFDYASIPEVPGYAVDRTSAGLVEARTECSTSRSNNRLQFRAAPLAKISKLEDDGELTAPAAADEAALEALALEVQSTALTCPDLRFRFDSIFERQGARYLDFVRLADDVLIALTRTSFWVIPTDPSAAREIRLDEICTGTDTWETRRMLGRGDSFLLAETSESPNREEFHVARITRAGDTFVCSTSTVPGGLLDIQALSDREALMVGPRGLIVHEHDERWDVLQGPNDTLRSLVVHGDGSVSVAGPSGLYSGPALRPDQWIYSPIPGEASEYAMAAPSGQPFFARVERPVVYTQIEGEVHPFMLHVPDPESICVLPDACGFPEVVGGFERLEPFQDRLVATVDDCPGVLLIDPSTGCSTAVPIPGVVGDLVDSLAVQGNEIFIGTKVGALARVMPE